MLVTICYCPLDKALGDIKYNGILTIRTSFLLLTEGARNLIFNHWLKALSIFVLKIIVVVVPVWVPQEQNQLADYLSKLTDVDDWGISPDFFLWISTLWGPFTVDRFATWYNTKCLRFNSRFWNPGCEGMDALTQNWHGENSGLVPHQARSLGYGNTLSFAKQKGL